MLECRTCRRVLDDDQPRCPVDGGAVTPFAPGPPLLDGKHALLRSLARGGSGLVTVARHLGLNQQVAVKMLHPSMVHSASAQTAFRGEARALGRLQHPHIIRVSDFGIDPRAGGIPYLVMELVEGESLRTRLSRTQVLSPTEALPLLAAIAAALDFSHAHGICHRDLKPENVLLVGSDDGCQVKVVDFGLACTVTAAQPAGMTGASERPDHSNLEGEPVTAGQTAGGIAGTPGYIAPEVLAGAAPGPAADLYALGVLAYEVLIGRRPFEAPLHDLVIHHLCSQPAALSTVRPELPAELDEVFLSALAKDPAKRPPSAGQFIDRLSAAVLTAEQRRWAARERPRRLAWAVCITLASLAGTWCLARCGLLATAEQRIVRGCFSLSRPSAPDPRLLLLSIDETTARSSPTLIAELDEEVGDLLHRVLAAGAAAVGIDLLLPEQWSRSESFTDLVITHPDSIVLALADRDGQLIGGACLQGPVTVVIGPQRAVAMLGVVNVDVATDGAVSQLRTSYRTENGSLLPSFATRLAEIAGTTPDQQSRHWIDFTTPPQMIPRLSWSTVAGQLRQQPEQFAGRVILLGQELTGAGDVYHGLPHPAGGSGRMTGLELQALMLNTLLGGRPIRDGGVAADAVSAGLAAALLSLLLLLARRPAPVLWTAALLDLVLASVSVALFILEKLIIPLASLLAPQVIVIPLFLVVSGSLHPCPQRLGGSAAEQPPGRGSKRLVPTGGE